MLFKRHSATAAGSARVLCVLALFVLGCGYQFVRAPTLGGGSGGSSGSIRIAVPALVNDSFDSKVAVLLTDALRRECLRRGVLRLVDASAAPDIVVVGRVLPIETFATSVSSVSAALEQQVEVEADLHAERGDGSEIQLPDTLFTEWELYLESADVEAARKNRDEALRRVASVIATRFHDVLTASLSP